MPARLPCRTMVGSRPEVLLRSLSEDVLTVLDWHRKGWLAMTNPQNILSAAEVAAIRADYEHGGLSHYDMGELLASHEALQERNEALERHVGWLEDRYATQDYYERYAAEKPWLNTEEGGER